MLSTSHRAVGHLDVFFGKMFIQVLCPILNLIIITITVFVLLPENFGEEEEAVIRGALD